MEKKKLISLIKKEENEKLDFKQRLDLETETGKKELAKDISAIANSRGGRGYLIIGIEDKTKNVVGIGEDDLREEQIQQIISSRCEPPIPISLSYERIEDKTIAIITIYDGMQKPYQIRENGAFYIRRGSTTDTMRKQELVSALQENLSLNTELCPIIRSGINYLDMKLVEKYFKSQGINVNEKNIDFLMENASIIALERETGKYHATLGGLLVFSKKNNVYIPHNMIRIINKTNKKFDDVIFIQGDLLSMIDKSEEIINNLLPPLYPSMAVCEAINNAILYRDYTNFYKEIEVIIDYGSVIIISPGNLIKSKDTKSHNYLRRNMWIYEKLIALDDKKRFVKSGRGFIRIKKAFKNHGKVKFINCTQSNNFKVIYPGVRNFE